MSLPSLLRCLWVTLAVAALPARAHDTWFAPEPGEPGTLALGTGTRFPLQDSGIDRGLLVAQGCAVGPGSEQPMLPLDDAPAALRLRPPAAARSCWVQLAPLEIEVRPALVPVYLDEIAASAALRQIWAGRQARGLPWTERYTKHARIELDDGTAPAPPAGLGLEMRVASGGRPRRAGEPLQFEVLRDGRPLAGLPVELRHENVAQGLWRRTDAQGRVSLALPWPGRWLMRGVDLRVAADVPDAWDSRFATLAFDVLPAAAAGSAGGQARTAAP